MRIYSHHVPCRNQPDGRDGVNACIMRSTAEDANRTPALDHLFYGEGMEDKSMIAVHAHTGVLSVRHHEVQIVVFLAHYQAA
jgi:hypothetical protein